MHTSTVENLRARAETLASSLDRLINADAAYAADADVLILEDASFALTLWAVARVLDAHQDTEISASTSFEGRSPKVFVRNRSYATSLALHELLQEVSCRDSVAISGIDAQGKISVETLAPVDFLNYHNFHGTLAMGKLPKSHGALADMAQAFSQYLLASGGAVPSARLVLGGNTKHMSITFNETLGRVFAQVRGLRGKGKNRCLEASEPLPCAESSQGVKQQSISLRGFGGVFSGAKADCGGQLLAQVACDVLDAWRGSASVLDFGCGNGSVTVQLLEHSSQLQSVTATDIDSDAVRSAIANVGGDSRVSVTWDDAAARLPDAAFDLVLLNPPFHDGTAVDMTLVRPLLAASHRLLVPGGTLLVVYNSHARYRGVIEDLFGASTQVMRDKTFTVVRATR
ncbi:methyltransferase [Rothia sp. ZJ1223]|uniref:class I SAM-dependent methyltransferase n=1 Tax=Rothia sp. ZJ1223 TaxID=2811098 RepID=UPI00195633DF|nr:methyltransferase [Rothia sp. ZJ1223]